MESSNNIVVDSSVIIAVIIEEMERDAILEVTKGKSLIAPGSIDWEIGNAFSAMIKRGSLSLDSVYDAISIFKKMMIRKMGVNFSNSMMLADRHKIYAYDAYFLEVCLKMNAPLLSLDKRLVQVAKMEQIETMEL